MNQDKRRRFDSYPGSVSTTSITVIVLAAGGGTRMKSKTMKVLHPLGGRSMIGHVLTAACAVNPAHVVAVAPRVGVEPTSLVLIQSQAGPADRPTGDCFA